MSKVKHAVATRKQASQNFTRVIMERTLSPLDRQEYARKMEQRNELGKKLLEKAHEKK